MITGNNDFAVTTLARLQKEIDSNPSEPSWYLPRVRDGFLQAKPIVDMFYESLAHTLAEILPTLCGREFHKINLDFFDIFSGTNDMLGRDSETKISKPIDFSTVSEMHKKFEVEEEFNGILLFYTVWLETENFAFEEFGFSDYKNFIAKYEGMISAIVEFLAKKHGLDTAGIRVVMYNK